MVDSADQAAFNSTEHLQSVCRQVVNKLIREDFNDISETTDITDIKTARSSLRRACWHDDDDSLMMTASKLIMYYLVVNKARKLQQPIYGIPKADYDSDVRYKPQLYFYFRQDLQAVPDGKRAVTARFHIRLIDETQATINPTKARALATDIKRIFTVNGQGITWDKGKVKCTYKDRDRGYDMYIYAISKAEAIEVIKKLLSIRNHPYVADYLVEHNPERSSVNNPTGTKLVYGQQMPNKRWRPTAKVRFIYASLQIEGLDEDVMLVDTRDPYNGLITA